MSTTTHYDPDEDRVERLRAWFLTGALIDLILIPTLFFFAPSLTLIDLMAEGRKHVAELREELKEWQASQH